MSDKENRSSAYRAYSEFASRQTDFFRSALKALTAQMRVIAKRLQTQPKTKVRPRTATRLENALGASGEWILVMLVTAAEAYLTDVLASCATVDPKLMEQSEQKVSYADVLRFSDKDELANELRRRWARNFVDDGGPKRWIDRLTRMGARGFHEDLADVLEEVWGIRHMVIHTGGRATQDFVHRHPNVGVDVGERIKIGGEDMRLYSDRIQHFIEVTDGFFVQRYGPGL